MFYWDFTIEAKEGMTVFDSPYFSEDTFGDVAKPNDEEAGWSYSKDSIETARIKNGRWKDLEAETNVKYTDLTNGYGYMRGPWNLNPSKYISRFAAETPGLPGCGNYKDWLLENDFSAFMKMSAYGPHSTTHTAIGGVYGCDMFDDMLDQGLIKDADNQLSICQNWGFYIKELYRGMYIDAPSDCSAHGTCEFTCNDALENDMLTALSETMSLKDYVPESLTSDDWKTWRDFICTGKAHKVFVGDHLESASPADPSFWPIHGTQERLLQLKYISGGFDDFDWPTKASTKDYVCNHDSCYETDDEGTTKKDYYGECCYGHYENDQLLDFVNGEKTSGYGPTNREILDGTDASSASYSMNYIYNDFSWDHCDDDFQVHTAFSSCCCLCVKIYNAMLICIYLYFCLCLHVCVDVLPPPHPRLLTLTDDTLPFLNTHTHTHSPSLSR